MTATLDDVELSLDLRKKAYLRRLEAAQKRLLELRLYYGGLIGDNKLGPPVCLLFEGWDAAGKGGAIRRLTAYLDPRHVRVVQFAAPTEAELRRHWLLRFWPSLPGWGDMTILDRSWYGRVLVERVEGFATPEEWQRAYEEIRGFEESLVSEGMVLLKFFVHISDSEQLRRFHKRRDLPLKQWKLTDEDWRNREKRGSYESAIKDMFTETDRPGAPWIVVPGNSKRYARVFIVETINRHLEEAATALGREVASLPMEDT